MLFVCSICCELCSINTDTKLQHAAYHPLYWEDAICRCSSSDCYTRLYKYEKTLFRICSICFRRSQIEPASERCPLSNMGLLSGHNMCKMVASSIPFCASLQSGSLGCCCRLWCLTSGSRTVRNQTQVTMMCPDFFLWCTRDVLGVEAPLGLFLRHFSFKTLRQSSQALLSALGSCCCVSMNIKVRVIAKGYDDKVCKCKITPVKTKPPHTNNYLLERTESSRSLFFIRNIWN